MWNTNTVLLLNNLPAKNSPRHKRTPPAMRVPSPSSGASGESDGGALEYWTPPAINSARPGRKQNVLLFSTKILFFGRI
jgi:hypothetical protein